MLNTRVFSDNPFLASPQVKEACEAARVNYLSTLARLQQVPHTIDWIERMQQESLGRLDQLWETALTLGSAGQLDAASDQLVWVLREWGFYRAFTDRAAAEALDVDLDPADGDVQADFEHQVQAKVASLAGELLAASGRGEAERVNVQARQHYDWQERFIAQMQQHQADGYRLARDAQTDLRATWEMTGRMHSDYARVALDGVKQAQAGVQDLYTYAADTQRHLVQLEEALQAGVQQTLPETVREAARERRQSRLFYVLLFAVVVIGGLAGGYLLLQLL